MTNEHQRDLVAYGYLVLGLLVPALVVYIVARLRCRVSIRRATSLAPEVSPLSPASALFRSLRWALVATILTAALCFVPGLNLLCYGALMLAGALVGVLGVSEPHVEIASCVILLILFLLFWTAFRFTQLVHRHG